MIQAEYVSYPEVTYVPRTVSIVFVIGHFTVVCAEPWPLNGSEAGRDLVLLQTFHFLCANRGILMLASP